MKKQKKEFSKVLLIQESVLIWIMSLTFLALAFYCISQGFLGTFPWLTAMVGFPWTAYGVSQVYYYKKSLAENTKDGIKFQAVIKEIEQAATKYQTNVSSEFNENSYTEIAMDETNDYQI